MTERQYSDVEKLFAMQLFNAYGDHCDWKAYNGELMRTWDQLLEMGSPVVEHWYHVARTAFSITTHHRESTVPPLTGSELFRAPAGD